VDQEGLVNGDRIRGVGEGGKPWGFTGRDELFGRQDVLGGHFGEDVSPVGGFGLLNGLKVSCLGLPRGEKVVRALEFLGLPGGLAVPFAESGNISKNNILRQGRPMRLAHLAHITSIANQERNVDLTFHPDFASPDVPRPDAILTRTLHSLCHNCAWSSALAS